jgi:hypothetical protein
MTSENIDKSVATKDFFSDSYNNFMVLKNYFRNSSNTLYCNTHSYIN